MRKVLILLLVFAVSCVMGCNYDISVSDDGSISAIPADDSSNILDLASSLNQGAQPSIPPEKPIESTYSIPHKDAKELLDPSRDYLIVVNKDNPYDFNGDYEFGLRPDLVYFPNDVDGDIMACEKATYLAYTSLKRDLLVNDNIVIGLYDGYRTPADQEYLINLASEGNPSISKTSEVGYSEHHTGLLLDVVVWIDEENPKDDEGPTWYSANEERLKTMDEFKTIYKKMVDYGFVTRYPSDKADITGYEEREYEIRFVGSAAVAHEIMDNDLCLEEYVAASSEVSLGDSSDSSLEDSAEDSSN